MRIACWASALICASSACVGSSNRATVPERAIEPVVAESVADHGRTRLVLRLGNAQSTVMLDRDATVAADAGPTRVDTIATIPGTAIVLVDKYPSIPGGLSYCQAGEEAFLRIISTNDGTATKRYDTKIASCRDNLELADPGVEWDANRRVVRVHWLAGPGGKEEERQIGIQPDGRVEVAPGKIPSSP